MSASLDNYVDKSFRESSTKGRLWFFKGGPCSDVPSLYFQASDLKWEFLLGGRHDGPHALDGTFYYNSRFFDDENSALAKDEQTKADFYIVQAKIDNVLYVHVTFYTPGSQEEPLGQFLAADPRNVSTFSGLLHKRLEGVWGFLARTIGDLRKKYHDYKPADALILKTCPGSNVTSFRLEVYELEWQFTDGFRIGSRIDGNFFYKSGFFDGENPLLPGVPNSPVAADYYLERTLVDGVHYVHATFYAPGSQDGLLGEFLGRDPDDISGESELLRRRREGVWELIEYITGTAIASKEANSTLITLDIPTLHKRADIHSSEEEKIYSEAFTAEGRVTIKTIELLEGDTDSVRWYKDRAVFTRHPYSSDFIAFFFTNDHPLGTEEELRWNNVKWLSSPVPARG